MNYCVIRGPWLIEERGTAGQLHAPAWVLGTSAHCGARAWCLRLQGEGRARAGAAAALGAARRPSAGPALLSSKLCLDIQHLGLPDDGSIPGPSSSQPETRPFLPKLSVRNQSLQILALSSLTISFSNLVRLSLHELTISVLWSWSMAGEIS